MTIVEMLPTVGQGIELITRRHLLAELRAAGVTILTNAKVTSIEPLALHFESMVDGAAGTLEVDRVATAVGWRPRGAALAERPAGARGARARRRRAPRRLRQRDQRGGRRGSRRVRMRPTARATQEDERGENGRQGWRGGARDDGLGHRAALHPGGRAHRRDRGQRRARRARPRPDRHAARPGRREGPSRGGRAGADARAPRRDDRRLLPRRVRPRDRGGLRGPRGQARALSAGSRSSSRTTPSSRRTPPRSPSRRSPAGLERPGRLVGMHFFNPAPVLPLVEIVRSELSDDDAFDTAYAFGERIGKEPIACRDTPGLRREPHPDPASSTTRCACSTRAPRARRTSTRDAARDELADRPAGAHRPDRDRRRTCTSARCCGRRSASRASLRRRGSCGWSRPGFWAGRAGRGFYRYDT